MSSAAKKRGLAWAAERAISISVLKIFGSMCGLSSPSIIIKAWPARPKYNGPAVGGDVGDCAGGLLVKAGPALAASFFLLRRMARIFIVVAAYAVVA